MPDEISQNHSANVKSLIKHALEHGWPVTAVRAVWEGEFTPELNEALREFYEAKTTRAKDDN